jgi:eukaryotic-like serine/threonine-protein kinase
MTPAQALSIDAIWQQWERRIVNARYPLLQYLGGSRRSAFYLTDIGGTKAAIKLIPAGTPRAAAQTACWRLSGGLSHPNLVKIVEIGLWHADQEQDMRFAVMEYCDESLADVLRQRSLTAAEARQMLGPTLDALKYLHSQSLLHGQIKPAHLLANGDQLKLSSDTIHRNGEGHPSAIESPYDAPEKAAGTISLSGDVWSLGITLFEALTGHLPGAGDAKAAEKLPAPFNAIVAGCLERDRERRLSLSAIRAILDKPATQSTIAPQQTAKPASNVIVLPAADKPDSETVSPALVEGSNPASSLEKFASTEKVTSAAPLASRSVVVPKSDNRQKMLVAVVAVVAVLAVALGLQLTRKTPNAAPATPVSVARPSGSSVAPAAKTSTRQPTPTGSNPAGVLHQEMPVVLAHAQNTISGTVKVKVQVSVGADGRVSNAKLATKGPSTYFANEALRAARQWTFAPPVRDGKAQASEWAIRFDFRRNGTNVSARQLSH